MAFPASSPDISGRGAQLKDARPESRHSVMIQSGETDDVEVAPEIESQTKPAVKPWAHLFAGGVGGMTAATLTSPLDVLKTRLQSDFYQAQLRSLRASHPLPQSHSILSLSRSAMVHFSETIQILRSIHVHEGWRALFKGLGPNLTGVVPARAINFYVYGNGKRILNDYFGYIPAETPASIHLAAAAMAGIATGTATNPIWLVKTRLQLDKSNASNIPGRGRQYKNSWDCIQQTVRHEGIRGLYRGLTASYLGVTESALQWVMYEEMKRVLARREAKRLADPNHVPNWTDFAEEWGGKLTAAGSAKLFAATVTYPHEVVRTRLRQAPTVQVTGGKAEMKYTGLIQCFRLVWKEEGMAGLYGGLTPHLLRVVPSAAIMFGM
ncbi:Pyrimidine nucleotide transporter, mitochondrial [Ophidiomyces ophidiicola]|uniref:Pyrimidine nucleotide transporter, mitochondrial n=1 Tax=Ophidiomyces ophidiicola TaxID=1387563 RepID=A0ACB8UYX6_9EURO|nr:Pyrimidine nucleotide transporter, mitochondrial [Ophidiomyces ophidiicola]KAI1910801.1 Pyrimidine nucleotide transporter, mitochondrial [Ophidiomyces ophidiicola]KAI1919780.1 Pyrimidine nucleotide transporter, mitochondrial [Ophidiomyces ophidiicola]KAI1929056.1 Pyrimidine nucleotide transporter, mitochondrial [Ophidiomyces ophidiicola]KAI1950041.1 Pyrimidine nucleotide transporter, mitochondrial [Ophidiomyces ophidiicola]KAI1950381.1 Pyrimidine nucleotide transporter, mitochondrial [Ophid